MSQTVAELNLSIVTLSCTTLSLFGSVCVISSYIIARTKTNPKAAQLILNLAVTDFFWFLASLLEFSFLVNLSSPGVPDLVCLLSSPVIVFTRQASLVWQCAISFDVYMSLNRRKWLWKGEESRWNAYRRTYIFLVLVFASPAAIVAMVKQHSGESNLGCSPGYEKLGSWSEIFFTEIFPIAICFFFILFIYFMVRSQMELKAFPQSVRKRRRRVQYYYIIACIVCWSPTIIFYLLEMSEVTGTVMDVLEVVARITLFLSGFVNFLIFGASDPHLRRSMLLIAYTMGLSSFIDTSVVVNPDTKSRMSSRFAEPSTHGHTRSDTDSSAQSIFALSGALRVHSTEKIVMFGGVISDNADISHDKYHCYNMLLSPDEKKNLYKERPDLDMSTPIPRSAQAPKPKSILKNGKKLSTDGGEARSDSDNTSVRTHVLLDLNQDTEGINSPRSSFTETEYDDSNDSSSVAHRDSIRLPHISELSKPPPPPETVKVKKSAKFSDQPAEEINPSQHLSRQNHVSQFTGSSTSSEQILNTKLGPVIESTQSQDEDEPEQKTPEEFLVGGHPSLHSDMNQQTTTAGTYIPPTLPNGKPDGQSSPPVKPLTPSLLSRTNTQGSEYSQASDAMGPSSRARRLSDAVSALYSIVTGTRRNSDADEQRWATDVENGNFSNLRDPLIESAVESDSSSDEEDEEDRELKSPLKTTS